MSPAGITLQTLVGLLGAPLVPAWSAWTTWLLARRERVSFWRVSSLLALSATWLVALTLREAQGGGLVGEKLLEWLDAGFGRSGGLALVSIAAAAAIVNLLGLERIMRWLAVGWHALHAFWRASRGPLRAQAMRVRRGHQLRRSAAAGDGPVILGPPSHAEPAIVRSSEPTTDRAAPVHRIPRAAHRETAAWRRPD